MLLHDYLDYDDLDSALCNGYVDRRDHPDLPLTMYTYSRSAQFDGYWTDAVRKSRGLIVDRDTDEIVAFCMSKFFNKSEHDNGKSYADPLPEEPVRVFDKMDGSMGTVYFYNGQWRVATKGSFLSDQAIKATQMLNAADTRYLNPETTYVVEIIYPDNRIVVDYKDRHDLVLLTSYDSEGNENLDPPEWEFLGFSYRPEVDMMSLGCSLDLDDLTDTDIDGTEAEGYVVRYESGLRVKMKFAEYLALHKILTNCTERTIWEALYSQSDLTKFRENVPDEFDEWVNEAINNILGEVNTFNYQADWYFMDIVRKVGVKDRKAFAQEASKLPSDYKSAMFLLYDGRSTRDLAFKRCYPKATKPFRQDDE